MSNLNTNYENISLNHMNYENMKKYTFENVFIKKNVTALTHFSWRPSCLIQTALSSSAVGFQLKKPEWMCNELLYLCCSASWVMGETKCGGGGGGVK